MIRDTAAVPATLPGYSRSVNSVCARAHGSPALRAYARIALLFRWLLYAALIVTGIFSGQMIADMLGAAWLPAVIGIGALAGTMAYILCGLRRAARRRARRAYLAEVFGSAAPTIVRGGDCL